MAHALETMAYANEVPWHGLGTKVDDTLTPEQMTKAAGLDWTVSKRPLTFDTALNDGKNIDRTNVEDHFALVRDSDNKFLSITGNRYTPTQNADAFAFFKEFTEAGHAKMETAGSLMGGKRVWGLANMQESFTLPGNDKVEGFLLVSSPHEQGKSLQIKFTPIRVVCNNTLSLALKGGSEFRMTHTRHFGSLQIRKAKEALGVAREMMDEFKENANELSRLKFSKAEVIQFLSPLFQPKGDPQDLMRDFADLANPKFLRVMDVYEKAPGAVPGTGWGVLNAVTYYADHATKARSNDSRLASAWLGENAKLKQKTLDGLLLHV